MEKRLIRQTVADMSATLDVFATVNAEMPIQQLSTLLAVAKHSGASVTELAKFLPQSEQAVARNVRILTAVASPTRAGYGLVAQKLDDRDSRKRVLCLTDKGELLMERLNSVFNGICKGRSKENIECGL